MTDASPRDVLWRPTPESIAATRVGRFRDEVERRRGIELPDYEALWRWSVEDLEAFWLELWHHFDVIGELGDARVLADRSMPGAVWFPGAQLNYAENVLRGPDDDVVLLAHSQTRPAHAVTRGELRDQVARARAGLRRLGVAPGDRVAAYLPNIPEAVVAMLATASLGAVWTACAPEFGPRGVLERFQQLDPTVLLAVDGYRYGDRVIDRGDGVRAIRAGLPTLAATVGVGYLGTAPVGDLTWDELLAEPTEPSYDRVGFDHPLSILFSSGTTGLPKAVVHSHGGITLEHLKSQALQNDLGPGDRYLVYATTSWVMWNIMVSGLLTGAALVLMDGDPNHPDDLELWRMVERTRATTFTCGASILLRARKRGQSPRSLFDLSSLRTISSTASPLPAEGFRWVYEHVSPTAFLQSGSGGTDVCSGFVGGSRMLPVRAGEIACRLLGVDVQAFDPAGRPVVGEPGELVVTKPMPSMPLRFWNDPDGERYRASYFATYPGVWRHGDWIVFNEHGGCRITGRSDATLNRGGVRMGTSEFYSALSEVAELLDSLVVHLEDPEGGLGELLLFVQLVPHAELDDDLLARIRLHLRSELSPRHVPDRVVAVPGIPYNVTGKKLEIPVKRLLQGVPRSEAVSDDAVREPVTLDAFVALARPAIDGEQERRG